MSAITGTAVTNLVLTENTAAEITYTAATNSGATTADTETFYITPTKDRGLIVIYNGCGQDVSFKLLGGDFWFNSTDQTAFTIATGKYYILRVDRARYLQDSGKYHLKATPTTTTALNASSKVNIGYIE